MFLIARLFFIMIVLFFVVTFVSGMSIFLRVRQSLRDPFLRPGDQNPPPPGKGDIIEGEFTVLDDKQK